jgi:preprotein translocase SecF subunit
MKVRRIAYILTAVMFIVSVAAFFTKGLNYGIDFEGGILAEISSKQEIDLQKIRSDLSFLKDLSIQSAGHEGKTILVQAQPEAGESATAVMEKIKTTLGADYSYDNVEVIGATLGKELKQKSILASVLALLAIAVYIWFRFEWPFAIGCLISLAHDLVVIVGLFALFGWEFDMIVVAGILSLAGYDCNDTIVTYDRIRENLKKYRKMDVSDILNKSINETLSRTIITGLTTLCVVLVLLFVGGPVLRGFSIAMVIGVIIGTYSSIFVAVPILNNFDIKNMGLSESKDKS